jgi:voltage-gated potassium channel
VTEPASWKAVALTIALLVMGYYLAPLQIFKPERPLLDWMAFALAMALLALFVVGQIASALWGGRNAVPYGLPVSLSLIVVVFAATYVVMSRAPLEFGGLIQSRTDALYFTVRTVATAGFGDLHRVGQAAKVAVTLQVVFDLVLIAGAAATVSTRMADSARLPRMRDRRGGPTLVKAADPRPEERR